MADAIHATLGDALAAIADRQPDAPLMHRPGLAPVTYGDLAEQLRYVNERLRGWGIAPGDVVAGFVGARPVMAMACLTLPASCTFTPLAPSFAAPAYEALLRRLRPTAVLVPADPGHPLSIATSRAGIPALRLTTETAGQERFSLEIDRPGTTKRDGLARPTHAYVLVTSGTTGHPKLAPLGHRQMLDYALAIVPWLELASDDVGYALAPFHFAGGLRASLLLTALSGGSFVCLDEADVDGFFRAISTHRPTCLTAPFSIHRAIASRASAFPEAVAEARFRYLRSTAGRLDPAVAERLERIFRAPVVQGYGSTEVCGIAHDPLPPAPRKLGSVGVALGGEVRTMDAYGTLLALGEPGEIVVRGPLVFDGYLDDPELTSRTFSGAWLRTGDFGNVDAEGYVFVGSRLAETINQGGEKIAPAEIDRVVEAMPGVREAAAFGLLQGAPNEVLALAVVVDEAAGIGEHEIREHLRSQLGERRVPRRILFIDALPRTDAGKLRRLDLAEMFKSATIGEP